MNLDPSPGQPLYDALMVLLEELGEPYLEHFGDIYEEIQDLLGDPDDPEVFTSFSLEELKDYFVDGRLHAALTGLLEELNEDSNDENPKVGELIELTNSSIRLLNDITSHSE
jgi:hypothetical protein